MSESAKRKWKSGFATGLCDFCGCREARHSINGSLWFICNHCMEKHYSAVPQVYAENMGEEE